MYSKFHMQSGYAIVLSTLRNGMSWLLISCSTTLMVLERAVTSWLICSIRWLIIRLFWSSSAFKAESLAVSCSFRKWWRVSNSSLICVSVCSAWFWKKTWQTGNHCPYTLAPTFVQGNIWQWLDREYLDMFCHFLTSPVCIFVQL